MLRRQCKLSGTAARIIASIAGIGICVTLGSAPARSANAAETVTNSIGMKLVLVPAGEFMMGAEEDRDRTLRRFPYCDPKWLDGELPRHGVQITRAFYMGQYEVTLGQFLTFCDAADYKKRKSRATASRVGDTTRSREWIPERNQSKFRPCRRPGWKSNRITPWFM